MRDFSPPTAPPSRTAHSTSFLPSSSCPCCSSAVGLLHPSLFVRRPTAARLAPSLRLPVPSTFVSPSRSIPSVANIGNVCRGHATGHQLHDLRFADLASRVHRHRDALGAAHDTARGTPAVHPSARVCDCRRAHPRTRCTQRAGAQLCP